MKPFYHLLMVSLTLILCACTTTSERTLPADLTRSVPWGAIDVRADAFAPLPIPDYDQVLIDKVQRFQQTNPGEPIPINFLLLSGGGLRGNFGVGVLNGWTQSGTRPEFDIVTGVSAGALMATNVFLGEEYDERMRQEVFTAVDVLASPKTKFSLFRVGNPYVGNAFAELLEQSITPEVLDAVAREYRKGRRLFIGTTNLDAGRFTIWDMGLIAISDRPDRVEQYRKVLLASASIPQLFPPVLFEVETERGTFEQLHVDGGVTNNVFIADYDRLWLSVTDELDLELDDFTFDIYVIHNGRLYDGPPKPPVRKASIPLVLRSIETMMTMNAASGIYKLWLLMMISGTNFHLASIPPGVEFSSTMTDISQEEILRLYATGFELGESGDAWLTQLPPENLDVLRDKMSAETLQNTFERMFLQRRLSEVEQ